VRHYQGHLAKRRAIRPDREYRPASAAEWDGFEQHFDKRKAELGQCGRPHATPCADEHACLRCPMLRIHPRMLGWHGEFEASTSPCASSPTNETKQQGARRSRCCRSHHRPKTRPGSS
jgi:hypothetical protein